MASILALLLLAGCPGPGADDGDSGAGPEDAARPDSGELDGAAPDDGGETADADADVDADSRNCPAVDLGMISARTTHEGTMTGRPDHLLQSCSFARGPEVTFSFQTADNRAYAIELESDFISTLSVRAGCGEAAPDLICAVGHRGFTTLIHHAVAGTPYVLIIGSEIAAGAYRLSITPVEDCDDGLDDDGDGLGDCASPHCAEDPACREIICDDGIDSDADGRLDCDDPDCIERCVERDCGDRVDNDEDTLTDCDDPDCESGTDLCSELWCGNGLDDDGDGLTDCDDPGCRLWDPCTEYCADGLDNNGNGLTDCLDPDCGSLPQCCQTACPAGDLGSSLGRDLATGTTDFACDRINQSCDTLGRVGREVAYTFRAPASGYFIFETAGTDGEPSLALYDTDDCAQVRPGTRLACADRGKAPGASAEVIAPLDADQRVLVVVDMPWVAADGRYALSIRQLWP